MIIFCCAILFLVAGDSERSPDLLDPIVLLSGEAPQDRFGECLALLGDLDDDGYSDFAVAASGLEGPDGPLTGAVYLYSGLNGHQIGLISGEAPFGRFGMSMVSGDLDSDGRIEIIIGAPYHTGKMGQSSGQVGVFSFPTCNRILTMDGPGPLAQFGTSLECMDVNGDGVEDILVGAPGYTGKAGPGSGAVFVYGAASGDLLYCFEGESEGDWFGYRLACIDADCDGHGDPVVAVPGFGQEGSDITGCVKTISGATGETLYLIPGSSSGRFACDLAVMPDLNMDGVQDLYITHLDSRLPRVSIYDGATGSLLFAPGKTVADLSVSHPLVSLEDLDKDGTMDLAVGYSQDEMICLGVYSGKNGTLLKRWIYPDPLLDFGYAQCTPLGTGLTGFPRLIVASNPYRNQSDDQPGKVGIYHLAPPGIRCIFKSEAEGGLFGHTTELIGDTNNDGMGDILVGAPGTPGKKGSELGKVYLYSGWGGEPLAVLDGETAGSRLGDTLSVIGDLDGDEKADFVACAPGFSGGGKNAIGRVYFYSSATKEMLQRRLTGQQPGERLGTAFLPLVDID
ncbi:MAG: integrin alpha, partial [Planctomycetes bacterium]|nr:integrin alpha [Planctomycetota bacterium]